MRKQELMAGSCVATVGVDALRNRFGAMCGGAAAAIPVRMTPRFPFPMWFRLLRGTLDRWFRDTGSLKGSYLTQSQCFLDVMRTLMV
jgi:hypothetical protein